MQKSPAVLKQDEAQLGKTWRREVRVSGDLGNTTKAGWETGHKYVFERAKGFSSCCQ